LFDRRSRSPLTADDLDPREGEEQPCLYLRPVEGVEACGGEVCPYEFCGDYLQFLCRTVLPSSRQMKVYLGRSLRRHIFYFLSFIFYLLFFIFYFLSFI
jgi:hypothetical protein